MGPFEEVVPLAEEVLRVSKRTVESGRVRVSVTTETVKETVRQTLRSRRVEVERIALGHEVREMPPSREEDGVLVIPVVEEVLVVEKRLVLKEEIRLRFVDTEKTVEQPVERSVQHVTVERMPPQEAGEPVPGMVERNWRQQGDYPMMRIITAMFDDRNQADAAVQRLTQELNVDHGLIQIHAADAASTTATTSDTQDTGFWASLKDLFVPDEDRHTYAEGMRRGSVVVSAQVEEGMLDDAMTILEHNGAVDLDSREAEWRQSGWAGYQADVTTDATVASSPSTAGLGVAATGAANGMAARTGSEDRAASAVGTADVGGEQVIPIVQEQVRVGKRDVERGRVRVRSYVVETPVTEQVTLRDEHVEVQRRAVDRPLTAADDAFREQVIEATETDEEAVVAKEARVVEEVTIRKDAAEHVETVQDTVRRTEVEVDDTTDASRTAGGVGSAGSEGGNPPGTAASRAVDETLGTNVSGANPTRNP